MKKLALFSLSPKLIIASIIPPAIVAFFACFAFTRITTNIIHKHVITAASSAVYKLRGDIQSTLQPNIDKMSNWQAIVQEIHEEVPLQRVMHGLSAEDDDTFFYYSTTVSRFEKDGFFINNQNWVPPADWMPNTREWFKLAVANNGIFTFTEPYIDDRTGGICATFSQAVLDKKKNILGVAAMDVMLDFLNEIVSDVHVSQNSNIYLLLSDGRFLTNPNPEKIINENYFTEDFTKILKKAGYSTEEFLDGKERTIIKDNKFYTICRAGSSPWFIMVDGPVLDFSTAFRKDVFSILVVLLILGTITALFNMQVVGTMRSKEKSLAENLLAETQNLAVSSKQTAATAQDQSTAVKEIVATMEDNTSLSEEISQKIKDVSGVAAKTNSDVMEGVGFIKENVRQLQEIADTNLNTINGIKELGDKIENIWDIVTLINSVADQAKIIAFNAELEASSAGEAGKNFHIVATEIRRLADGIIDGTKEIKGKISEIQESSDALILASETGTEKIHSGVSSAKNLEARFGSIKGASEITAESAEKITTIIQQQAVASEQILVTLKQISSGVENFTSATDHISKSSQNLKSIALKLSDRNKEDYQNA